MCSSDPERIAIHLFDKDMDDICVSKLEKLCTPYFSVSCACCSMLNLRACANSSSTGDGRIKSKESNIVTNIIKGICQRGKII